MKSTNIASGSTFGRLTVVACAAPSKRRKTREALEKGADEHAAAEAK